MPTWSQTHASYRSPLQQIDSRDPFFDSNLKNTLATVITIWTRIIGAACSQPSPSSFRHHSLILLLFPTRQSASLLLFFLVSDPPHPHYTPQLSEGLLSRPVRTRLTVDVTRWGLDPHSTATLGRRRLGPANAKR